MPRFGYATVSTSATWTPPVIQESKTKQLILSKYGNEKINNEFLIYEHEVEKDNKNYLVTKKTTELFGTSLSDAFVAYDQLNRPYIAFSLDSKGTEIFSKMTSDNIGNKIEAIIGIRPLLPSELNIKFT